MEASKQTGSHNLVLGNQQSYSSYDWGELAALKQAREEIAALPLPPF